MIVVYISVWITIVRGARSIGRRKFDNIAGAKAADILVGDLVLLEVLQGARHEGDALLIEERLRAFLVQPMVDVDLALAAAKNFRWLRTGGVTIRKTIDLLIATFCIERNHELLHEDRDFDLPRNICRCGLHNSGALASVPTKTAPAALSGMRPL